MFLAGDIGGTKTHIALFEKKGNTLKVFKEYYLRSTQWTSLSEVLLDFLHSAGFRPEEIISGCLSLAGPIQEQTCRLVNLNRTLDLASIRDSFPFRSPLLFCNDLVATGHGISALDPKDLVFLNPTVLNYNSCGDNVNPGLTPNLMLNRAVIAPGTGLGESIIVGDNHVCPTEGAHADFAPRNELEVRLWRFLTKEYGHVSYERVLSGPGLTNLYRFLKDEDEVVFSLSLPNNVLTSNNQEIPTPSEITEKALSGTCPLSTKALELFIQLLGAEAGNLALKSLALGGVYLGGGIPPKILSKLQERSFLEAFQAKGRFSELLQGIPVYVILNERTALLGAAKIALRGKI
jgi:glucokinase